MAILLTIRILTLYKVLHLESTDVCNLACPACARELDIRFDKSSAHHLTIDQIEQKFNREFISGLNKMFMCGNYGDPAAGKNTLEIYRYFRYINPTITLGMNTNGALKTPRWWINLAGILNQPRDYVVFSIDGLEDTNSVYRVNSSWDTLIRNVTHFINAGGSAHWDMLVYRHNEHQVESCRQLAKDLGFKWFRTKVSKRPLVNELNFPNAWNRSKIQSGQIDCHALRESSIYMDAQGRVSPCCWLGSRQNNFITDIATVQETWSSANPNDICIDTCSLYQGSTKFKNQWQQEIQLN